MASNIQLFLGDKPIAESYLGDKFTELNYTATTLVSIPIPTASLDFWFDSSTYSGTGNWLSSFGNATASLFNVTKIAANGGTLDFQSSSILEVTSSGVQPNYSTLPGAGFSIIAIAKASGSAGAGLSHKRLINGKNNNWLFGTLDETHAESWYNNNFVSNENVNQDFKYRIYAGVNYTNASASMYVNGKYVGGSTAGGQYGPNGIGINKGDYIAEGNPASGQYTYTMFNQLLVYSRALTDAELSQIFTYFSGSYL